MHWIENCQINLNYEMVTSISEHQDIGVPSEGEGRSTPSKVHLI